MDLQGSFSYSYQPGTGPYLAPDEFSPHPHTYFVKSPLTILSTSRSPNALLSFGVSREIFTAQLQSRHRSGVCVRNHVTSEIQRE